MREYLYTLDAGTDDMAELRKDYLLDRWVIINARRGLRPKQFKSPTLKDVSFCFFCPGNENTTPPEIYRKATKSGWDIRVFPNKFAVVDTAGKPGQSGSKGLLHDYAFGYHEVVAETSDHKKQLWDLSQKKISDILKVYHLRIMELSKRKNIKYVLIFKNHGEKGGTSIVHTHTQITALHYIPPDISNEMKAAGKKCGYCDVIKRESRSKRLAFQNKSMVAFCPYASRFNYELWIFPKRHVRSFDDFSEGDFDDLAELLRKSIRKLRRLDMAYNFFLHYSPKGQDLHFHIEVTPRKAIWAGFELGSGTIINSVSPEQAAEYYRE